MRFFIAFLPTPRQFVGLALMTLAIPSSAANSQASLPPTSTVSYSSQTVAQLIQELTEIDSPAPGIDGGAMFGGFIADDSPATFVEGVVGVPSPGVPPQMRELVRRGANALPELVRHLDDKRATKLKVGNLHDGKPGQIGVNEFMGTYFSAEYDPRKRKYLTEEEMDPQTSKIDNSYKMKGFSGSYTIKVGDVCFVLVGQIVNRYLLAARYQPTGTLVVNSPLEFPELAQKTRDICRAYSPGFQPGFAPWALPKAGIGRAFGP